MVRKTVLLLIILFSFIGCAAYELRSPVFNVELIKQLQRGVTNKQEALTIFGNPTRVELEKGLEKWVYLGERGGVAAASVATPPPTHALTRSQVSVLPEKRGETPAVPGRKTRELTLFFEGNTLVEYNIRDR